MELRDSKTMKNLLIAFSGESQARNKYDYYASKARKDGFEQIASIFEETARNEKEHAKIWFKLINNGISETEKNLIDAANGENQEWTSMYKEFAIIAREEGFEDIAKKFEGVGAIEKEHEERYKKLVQNIENKKVFEKGTPQIWICRNCGHIHYGPMAPDVCPVCNHPQAYFEVKPENY